MSSIFLKALGTVILIALSIGLYFLFLKKSHKSSVRPSPLLTWLTQEPAWFNVLQPLQASDLQNRIIIVDFWTAGCINCQHLLPELAKIEQRFKHAITVIGVHSGKFLNEHVEQTIHDALKRYDIHHPVVNDKHFKIWKTFDIHAWPTILVISPEGKIYKQYSGENHTQHIINDIETLLQQYPNVLTTPLQFPSDQQAVQSPLLFPTKICYTTSFEQEPALFIADSGHHQIKVCQLSGKIVQTIGSGISGFLDGNFETAQYNWPQGLAWDGNNKILYVADTKNHMLRMVDFNQKTVSRIAGTGARGSYHVSTDDIPVKTALASPWDLAFFPNDTLVTIAQAGTHQLWLYEVNRKRLRILAGNGREGIQDGQSPYATMAQPSGLAVGNDNTLYIVDAESSALRSFKERNLTTLIGRGLFDFGFTNGKADHAQLQHPQGIAVDHNNIYIADTYNHAIRVYNLASKEVVTLIGNGIAGNALGNFSLTQFNEPNGVVKIENRLYIADTNNHRIVVADLDTMTCSELKVT